MSNQAYGIINQGREVHDGQITRDFETRNVEHISENGGRNAESKLHQAGLSELETLFWCAVSDPPPKSKHQFHNMCAGNVRAWDKHGNPIEGTFEDVYYPDTLENDIHNWSDPHRKGNWWWSQNVVMVVRVIFGGILHQAFYATTAEWDNYISQRWLSDIPPFYATTAEWDNRDIFNLEEEPAQSHEKTLSYNKLIFVKVGEFVTYTDLPAWLQSNLASDIQRGVHIF